MPDGSKVLHFDQIEFAAFDIYILQRPVAEADYIAEEIEQAKQCFNIVNEEGKMRLIRNIIAGLPGGEEGYTPGNFVLILRLIKRLNRQNCVKILLFSERHHTCC